VQKLGWHEEEVRTMESGRERGKERKKKVNG
jgi:hypothetical protein